jgi:hypothetical protein
VSFGAGVAVMLIPLSPALRNPFRGWDDFVGALHDHSDALLFDLNEPFEPEVPQRLAQV